MRLARLALAVALHAAPAVAQADPYDIAVGQVAAAQDIAKTCSGLGLIGAGDEESFVDAAADILKAQGLKPNRFKKLIYYGQTTWINQMEAAALAERGGSGTPAALCAFGRKVAGTNDGVGRFLVRER